jgi:hypothetical protein
MSQVWRTSFGRGGVKSIVEANSHPRISETLFNFKDFKKIFGKTEGLVRQNGRIGEAKRKDW